MKKHLFATRLLHGIIACLIITQLFTIYALDNKLFNKSASSFIFSIHKYGGLVAFVALFAFLIFIFKRTQGTKVTELFPWFSSNALCHLKDDLKAHIKALFQFKVPEHTNHAPLASAFHGLGIIIMSIMAITGVHRFIIHEFSIAKTPLIKYITSLHHVFSDYAWIYLIVHFSVAILNHFIKRQPLSEMWSFKK